MATLPTSYLPGEEEEARQAEIDRLVSGFGTELAAGMEAGGLPVGAGDPPPADPRAGLPPPVAHGEGPGRGPLPVMNPWEGERPSASAAVVDPWANEPRRPTPPAAPASPATAAAPTPRTVQQAPGGAQQTRPAAQTRQAAPPDLYGEELAGLRAQLAAAADPGERRRRIVAGILMGMQGRSPDQIRGALGPSPRDRQAAIAEQMTRLRGAQGESQQRAAQLVASQEEARQRQANTERDFALRERGIASLEGHRTAQSEIGRGRLGLQQHTQEWREEQAQIERDAKEVRARIIAGQRVGRGGTPMPGGAPGAEPGGPNVDDYLDAPVIRGFLSIRPEYMETARQLADETRAAGGEANEEEIAWELASRGFSRLPRDEQDRIRRAFMSPEGSTGAANAPRRDEDQLTTRVRQYGAEARERVEWEGAVNRASRALSNVPDAELRAAQQWLQGGAARQSIAAGLAPRAEQIGQAIAELQDIMLKERSGAAVTDSEFARLRSELGTNWWSSPESLRRAIGRMRATNDAIQDALGAEYGVEVVDAYEANRRAVRNAGARRQVSAGDTVTIGGQQVVLTAAQADAYNRRHGGQQ
jgi:hypothetical protein